MNHVPVLQREVLEYLAPKPNENFIDATIGGGGHAFRILEQTAPDGKLLGIDANEEAVNSLLQKTKEQEIRNRLIFICDNFSNLQNIVAEHRFDPVRGVLADLGFSSQELELSGRGFSFLRDEPLDMRYSTYQETKNQKPKTKNITAAEIINNLSEKEISETIWKYGEEKFSRRIARKIVEARRIKPVETTFGLVDIIKEATPSWYHHKKIHFATRTFQALRIVVNNELENLEKFLPQAFNVLAGGGRLAIISFHSLEDRIVKNFFKQKKEEGQARILTKKPIKPSEAEIAQNPRSRSAKLRVLEKI